MRATPGATTLPSRRRDATGIGHLSLKFQAIRPVSENRDRYSRRIAAHPARSPPAGIDMLKTGFARLGTTCATPLRRLAALTGRELDYLLSEISQVRGLMPLLMKRCNKCPWTLADKTELRSHLKRLRQVSPYIVLSILPGSILALPVLAWWLDRRRRAHSSSVTLPPDLPAADRRESQA